jgi:hypothetical protein
LKVNAKILCQPQGHYARIAALNQVPGAFSAVGGYRERLFLCSAGMLWVRSLLTGKAVQSYETFIR